MSRFTKLFKQSALAVALSAAVAGSAWAQSTKLKLEGVGRTATPAEIKAWDIDVRPDFKGLPAGSGSVSKGQDVWEAKCASCHGVFGESTEVFTPIVGGTTKKRYRNGQGSQSVALRFSPAHDHDESCHGFYTLGLHQPCHALE